MRPGWMNVYALPDIEDSRAFEFADNHQVEDRFRIRCEGVKRAQKEDRQ